jgi:hypothetical protein
VHDSSACVNSDFLGDNAFVAYGRPIKIGNGKIELANFPDTVKDGTPIAGKVIGSRKAISDEQQVYTNSKVAEDKILPVLKRGGCEIFMDDKTNLAVFEFKKETVTTVTDEEINDIKKDLALLLGAEKVAFNNFATERTLACTLEPKSMGAFRALAEELGVKIEKRAERQIE